MPSGLLTGFRALDLTDTKGWACGQILAALGVEVVKVEPHSGDPGRAQPLSWAAFNRAKKSVVVDLESEAGRATLTSLIAGTDFLIESANPGSQAALGIDYAGLHARHPSLIVTSISHFGQAGPRSH